MLSPVIFDFNGTMFLDTEKNEKAWGGLIEELTGHYPSPEEFKTQIHGVPNPDIIRHFLQEPQMSLEQTRSYCERKEEIYRRLCLADAGHLHLTPGLPAFLDYLKEHGVPINIATGADIGNVNFYREHMALDTWFDAEKIVYSDGTFPGKPDPYIYNTAAERIGVDMRECYVFEDAYLGVKSASRAHARRIIGLAAIPASAFLYTMKEVAQVITDFNDWEKFYLPSGKK